MNTTYPATQFDVDLVARAIDAGLRPEARGKFLFLGEEKLWVKGVTYGTFGEDENGDLFPAQETVRTDFRAMVANGINALRVYTIPPVWLLDLAAEAGLLVMVGLPWEQHVAFLDDPALASGIEQRLANSLDPCVGHPAILAFAIGNEIPASVVRWLGKRKVEQYLARLADIIRQKDQATLVTYVNFPTTEYLELPFVDFLSFNVYLEEEERLRAYLARLQNLADERPLVMAEIGLDSRRNGTKAQAEALAWQVTAAFEMGCSGTFAFAWTDEWYRGGAEIEDWDFGLVTRDRQEKAALTAVRGAYANAPISDRDWPPISVVVCSYNGAQTIGETLEGLKKVDYPHFEVIVVDDGSTDETAEIAAQFDVNLISTPNNGLSHARNLGLHAATGEIVAYTDDDAWPDPHWLKYLALAFMRSDHAAVGGPNIPPVGDGVSAQCVANAPGGPVHVLVSDEEAEHIPGCNMSFRREKLLEIDGFDPRFRTAGDDVDCCWRIQEVGGTLGFCAAAMVWHRRRPSIKRYFKQQRGYARAEALLAEKWPGKYNGCGHLSWHGRLYGRGLLQSLTSRQRLYHGQWGSAPFQSLYAKAPDNFVTGLPLMPEWYFFVGMALLLGVLGFSWPPLFVFAALGIAGIGISIAMAAKGALAAQFPRNFDGGRTCRHRLTVFWLHLVQPYSRLVGRIMHGLGPWDARNKSLVPPPLPRELDFWSGTWRSTEDRLQQLTDTIRSKNIPLAAGGDFDPIDLTVRGTALGGATAIAMVEEHGLKGQRFRLRLRPTFNGAAVVATLMLVTLACLASFSDAPIAAVGTGFVAVCLLIVMLAGSATAMRSYSMAFAELVAADEGQRHDKVGDDVNRKVEVA